MWKRNVGRIVTWLACLAIGCLLIPALSRANLGKQATERGRQATESVRSVAVLGVTPTKVLTFTPKSVRDPDYPHEAARDATGDTYGAAGLVQDQFTAFFLDDIPDDHTFGTGEETAGANLLPLSGVDMRIIGVDFGPGVPGTNLIQVNYFTVDGSDLVPAGSLSEDGLILDAWRMDVGQNAAPPDQIEWTPNPGFTVVESGICLFIEGEEPLCFDLALDGSGANGVSGVGVVGLGGDDIAGFPVNEMAMFWVIQMVLVCGDGNLNAGEECDDGNLDDCDGCSSACTIENILHGDTDFDGDVDLLDLGRILNNFTGPIAP